jgi:hypothetical protein
LSDYAEIIITPKQLTNCTILQRNFTLGRCCEVLLSGSVYNEKSQLIQGAVIEVIAIHYPNVRNMIGYVLTNEVGEFAIVVKKNNYINYQLNIYEPLIKI